MTSQSPASELDTEEMPETGIQTRAVESQGLPALAPGVFIDDATEEIPDLLDQDDLEGQPFALLDVRLQDKIVTINDVPYIEYTMVVCQVQPVDLTSDKKAVAESGGIFVMIAGRDGSVFGKEMMGVWAARGEKNALVFPSGIRRKDLGNGQGYYTVRPERDPSVKVTRDKLFKKA